MNVQGVVDGIDRGNAKEEMEGGGWERRRLGILAVCSTGSLQYKAVGSNPCS